MAKSLQRDERMATTSLDQAVSTQRGRIVNTQHAQMNASEEDESSNPQKRRRVSKACDRCRQGKLKCNGAMPQCGTCLEAKKPCSYGATMRRRGLRTGYVRALECLWGLVFQSIEGSQPIVEKLIENTSRKSFWVRDDLRDGPKAEETPLETWKLSRIPEAIDALLSANEDMDDDDQTTVLTNLPAHTKDVSVPWSLLDRSPSGQRSQPISALQVLCQRCRGEVQEQTWKHSGSAADQNKMDAKAYTTSNRTSQGALPELPHNPQKLLDRYFALTHSWFPIVERYAVYRSLFAYRKRLAVKDVDNSKSGEIAVLWAIFAYATMMFDLPCKGQGLTRKPTPHLDELYMTARNIIPLEKEDNYSIGHVQALLILELLHHSSCQWSIARMVIGQAILLANHIGLDQRDTCQTDHHRRTWLGCFVLDTLTSAHTGKPPRIRSHHVQAFFPIDEAGNEEWEPWYLQEALLPGVEGDMAEFAAPTHALSVFNKLLDLLCITNDWMCSTTGELNHRCKQALESWDDGLPEHIKTFFGANTFSTASISPPANILNLFMVHALLYTKLSDSVSPRPLMGPDCGQEWQRLIHAMEGFFGRFDQRAIPPSFNLLKNVLPQSVAEKGEICELIAKLKKEMCSHESTQQSQSDLHGRNIFENENLGSATMSQHHNGTWPSESSLAPNDSDLSQRLKYHTLDNINAGTMNYSLDPRIEQNFGSFKDMPGSWSNVATDLLLEPQNGPPEDLNSQLGQSTVMTGGSSGLSSHGVFPEGAALGYFNAWDGLEIQDREQFRRNLGFTF